MSDLRLVPLALAIWGCVLAVPRLPTLVVAGSVALLGVAGVAVLAAESRRRGRGLAVAVVLFGTAVAGVVTALHVAGARAGPLPALADDAAVVVVELRVWTDPVRRESHGRLPPYVVFQADVRRVTGRGVTTRIRTPVVVTAPRAWARVLPGQVVRATGRLAATGRAERAAAVFGARSPPDLVQEAGVLDRAASGLRAGLRAAVAGLPPAERGLVPALVVGDVSLMPAALVADFRTSGLSHLSAVSGTNLTILLAFVLGAGRRLGVRTWGVPVLGLACVGGFVLLARPEPSVLRAAAMGLVGLAGLAGGSRRLGVPALALAVTGLLLVDPWLGQAYGFVLSVLATAGILALGPLFTAALRRWSPRFVAVAVAVPLAAYLACAPVVAVLSDSVSLVAVAANLLAGPAVVPATVLGVLATLLAPVSVLLASVPARLAGVAARWIVEVATHAADLPGASVGWPVSTVSVAVLVLLSAAAAVGASSVLRRRGVTLALAGLLAVWLVHPARLPVPLEWATGWPPDSWVVVACDVGQGDGLVLRAGPKTAVVVDTGPEPEPIDRCLADLGVRNVPYVLLSHFHSDHVSGLPGVLRGRDVGEIGVGPLDSPTGEARRVRTRAAAAGVPVAIAGVGERRRVGEVTWTVLGPVDPPDSPGTGGGAGDGSGLDGEGSAENDASVVVKAEVRGVRVLLTGDVEPPGQRDLLRSGADLRAEVLKVPHHGSRYQDPEFLAAVGARVALVCVGADNDYGHPAQSTLDGLRSQHLAVARTDTDGAVAIVVDAQGLGVVSRRGRADQQAAGRQSGAGVAVRVASGVGQAPGVGQPWDAWARWLRPPPPLLSTPTPSARSRSSWGPTTCCPSARSPPPYRPFGPPIPTPT